MKKKTIITAIITETKDDSVNSYKHIHREMLKAGSSPKRQSKNN